MSLIQTTPVPNRLLDEFLFNLKEVELKVVLIIIRKTLGWIDKKNPRQRKQFERISIKYFILKTGCSRRGISNAIQSLIDKGVILVYDEFGYKVLDPEERKGKYKLYFQSVIKPVDREINKTYMHNIRANFTPKHEQILPDTIKENTEKKIDTNELNSRDSYQYKRFHITNYLINYKKNGSQQ